MAQVKQTYSEEEIGRKWDRCITDGILKTSKIQLRINFINAFFLTQLIFNMVFSIPTKPKY